MAASESVGERALAAAARRAQRPAALMLRRGPLARGLHRRASRAWRASEQPLFVCYGNINRSPFAAALARRLGREQADSAGLYPEQGRSASPEAVACARRRGIELASHRSRTASPDELAAAKAIFAFDLDNLARIAWRTPRALRRTHLLGSLLAAGPVVIDDPHGDGEAAVERAFDLIEAALGSVRGPEGG